MRPYNPQDDRVLNWQYIAKASFVICFVLLAGFAFQASEHVTGCISLLMVYLAPKLGEEE